MASELEFNNEGGLGVGRLAGGVGGGFDGDVASDGDVEVHGLFLAALHVEGEVVAIGVLGRDDQRSGALDGVGVDSPVDDKLLLASLASLGGGLHSADEGSAALLILVLQREVHIGLFITSLLHILATDSILHSESIEKIKNKYKININKNKIKKNKYNT